MSFQLLHAWGRFARPGLRAVRLPNSVHVHAMMVVLFFCCCGFSNLCLPVRAYSVLSTSAAAQQGKHTVLLLDWLGVIGIHTVTCTPTQLVGFVSPKQHM